MRQNFDIWVWFVNNKMDELYEIISLMIENKVKELLPQMIDE